MNPDFFAANIIVAIDGPSGSGKSTLADALAYDLDATIIRTDDFTDVYEPWSGTKPLLDTLRSIRKGATVLNYPRLQAKSTESTDVIDQPVNQIVIVEGVGASRAELRDYYDYIIFITAPVDVREERIIARDVDDDDGRTLEEQEEIGQIWDRAEKSYLATKPEQYANITLDGELPMSFLLEGLEETIRNAGF